MNKLIKTGSLAAVGVFTAGLVAWQAPAAFADHGADDVAGSSMSQRHSGDDDRATDDRRDDRVRHHARHGHHHDGARHHRGVRHDDGPRHDAGDDHGGRHGGRHGGHGADD